MATSFGSATPNPTSNSDARPFNTFVSGTPLRPLIGVEQLVLLFVARLNADVCPTDVDGFIRFVHNRHGELHVSL